jgi:hypothetical protein
MKKFITNSLVASLAASLCVLAAAAVSADIGAGPVHVTGEKLDSGLGDLPHYSRWGEKLDSGLGDLPHYSKWADPTGKNPLQNRAAAESSYGKQADASLKRDSK